MPPFVQKTHIGASATLGENNGKANEKLRVNFLIELQWRIAENKRVC